MHTDDMGEIPSLFRVELLAQLDELSDVKGDTHVVQKRPRVRHPHRHLKFQRKKKILMLDTKQIEKKFAHKYFPSCKDSTKQKKINANIFWKQRLRWTDLHRGYVCISRRTDDTFLNFGKVKMGDSKFIEFPLSDFIGKAKGMPRPLPPPPLTHIAMPKDQIHPNTTP